MSRKAADITVFGAEPHPNYNRILLSPVLAGEQTLDEIVLNDWSWYQDHGITLHAGWTVTDVDRVRRVVHARNAAGETLSAAYDRLLLATGSNPFILPIPGKDLEGVIAYRDIADTNAMIEASQKYTARRGHRWRPAGPGSGQRPDEARHAGDA
jgi:nitrite reductase (NADH) large subunit